MSGILDNKTRVFDVLLTQEGRRQVASGELRMTFATFTDDATYYSADVASGSSDATLRTYFEACNLPQDQITFEANDAGKLNPFKGLSGISIVDGKIVTSLITPASSSLLTGSAKSYNFLTGSEFASTSNSLLSSSIENFENLRILGTKGKLLESNLFDVSMKDIEFSITQDRPIPSNMQSQVNLAHIEGLIGDPRLSRSKNFRFLPPINKNKNLNIDTRVAEQIPKALYLASYKPWGLTKPLEVQDIVRELAYYEQVGYSKELKFDPTSRNNMLIGQIFELSNNQMSKLDVIEYGKSSWTDGSGNVHWWHVFFAGKVFVDGNGDQTFVHIFTLVFR
jgi:hypothetical protein